MLWVQNRKTRTPRRQIRPPVVTQGVLFHGGALPVDLPDRGSCELDKGDVLSGPFRRTGQLDQARAGREAPLAFPSSGAWGKGTATLQLQDLGTVCALRAHCVRIACILRTQRLGYSPKNTCHLFTRGKTERCQYHRVGQVSIDTSGCSYHQQHRRRRTVRSWCRLATIEYRRSRAFERR